MCIGLIMYVGIHSFIYVYRVTPNVADMSSRAKPSVGKSSAPQGRSISVYMIMVYMFKTILCSIVSNETQKKWVELTKNLKIVPRSVSGACLRPLMDQAHA